MLPLPPENEETKELADWLELNALVGQAGQISLDNMRDSLRTGTLGYIGEELPMQQAARLEEIAADVRGELESRARRARRAYPFRLRGSSLERVGVSHDLRSSTYAFCLMLSAVPWEERKIAGYFPDRIFEELSSQVAEKYLGGKALRFGWPRKTVLPSRFGEAVTQLCVRMGEGTEYRADLATGTERDAGLDVVAWRSIDERPGKLLLFGACATGRNWVQKLNDLQPQHFCGIYLRDPISPQPAKAFFTPRIVPQELWRSYTSMAGVLFDRCRVSVLAPQLPKTVRHGDAQEWMEKAMGRARREAA